MRSWRVCRREPAAGGPCRSDSNYERHRRPQLRQRECERQLERPCRLGLREPRIRADRLDAKVERGRASRRWRTVDRSRRSSRLHTHSRSAADAGAVDPECRDRSARRTASPTTPALALRQYRCTRSHDVDVKRGGYLAHHRIHDCLSCSSTAPAPSDERAETPSMMNGHPAEGGSFLAAPDQEPPRRSPVLTSPSKRSSAVARLPRQQPSCSLLEEIARGHAACGVIVRTQPLS